MLNCDEWGVDGRKYKSDKQTLNTPQCTVKTERKKIHQKISNKNAVGEKILGLVISAHREKPVETSINVSSTRSIA